MLWKSKNLQHPCKSIVVLSQTFVLINRHIAVYLTDQSENLHTSNTVKIGSTWQTQSCGWTLTWPNYFHHFFQTVRFQMPRNKRTNAAYNVKAVCNRKVHSFICRFKGWIYDEPKMICHFSQIVPQPRCLMGDLIFFLYSLFLVGLTMVVGYMRSE